MSSRQSLGLPTPIYVCPSANRERGAAKAKMQFLVCVCVVIASCVSHAKYVALVAADRCYLFGRCDDSFLVLDSNGVQGKRRSGRIYCEEGWFTEGAL